MKASWSFACLHPRWRSCGGIRTERERGRTRQKGVDWKGEDYSEARGWNPRQQTHKKNDEEQRRELERDMRKLELLELHRMEHRSCWLGWRLTGPVRLLSSSVAKWTMKYKVR